MYWGSILEWVIKLGETGNALPADTTPAFSPSETHGEK
jgi:hypothetical protein